MRPGLPLLSVLLLLGCARPGAEESARAALADALTTHQASVTILGATDQAVATRSAAIGGRAVAAAVEGSVPPPPAPAEGRADGGAPTMAGQLVGQPPETVMRWLGTPRLRRREGPAEVWHYQASQCHLDLVLYRDEGAGQALRVAFAAARAAGASRRGEAACLSDNARGAARPPLTERVSAGL
jgi:hypothetical protein